MQKLIDAVQKYLIYCQYEKHLNPLSIKAYRQDLDQFITLNSSISRISEMNREVMRNYVRRLFDLGLQSASVRRKVASLKAFVRFLELEDAILSSPFQRLNIHIRLRKHIPKYLSLHDVRRILTEARNRVIQIGLELRNIDSVIDKMNELMVFQKLVVVELLFATGVRVRELCDLDLEDVDMFKQLIKVSGKGARDRSVVITHPELFHLLFRQLSSRKNSRTRSNALFINRYGNRLQPQSIRKYLAALSRDARLPFKVTPHMLRHTVATLLIENGVDMRYVQKFLGHSSILTTQIYTHPSTQAERNTIEIKHPRNMIDLSNLKGG